MARTALEHALPAGWIDEVFEQHRQRQYTRELLFSTVVRLTMLVALGLRSSLHAAAREAEDLTVSLPALYDKVNRTEPDLLRALVRGSATRLAPVMTAAGTGHPSLPGYALRVLDGNHLPGSDKRLKPLRAHRGAALPGQTLVVYDPDTGLAVDLVAAEDAYADERALARALLDAAAPGQVWVADRHFCVRTWLQGLVEAGSHFVVRRHGNHPRLGAQGDWQACGSCETGTLCEQSITLEGSGDAWRRIALSLTAPTTEGDRTIWLWSNLPASVSAAQIAQVYRRRWRIEGLFLQMERVLHSEAGRLGRPRAALLGFAAAVLAHNVLSLLSACIEQVHGPEPRVSVFHLSRQIGAGYEGLMVALGHGSVLTGQEDAASVAARLLALAERVDPGRIATSPRGPKRKVDKPYVAAATARKHVATARVLEKAKLMAKKTP
ncbi:MAG: IS4 family transposase [Methylorubrum populi]